MNDAPPGDSTLCERLRQIDCPTLSNAIELLNVRPRSQGFTPLAIRCLFPELGRLCGRAVTAQAETMTEMHPTSEEAFLDLFRAVETAPKPAVVVFQEIGGHPDYAAHCGEVMATLFTRLGAVGLVTDCAVRDVPEMRALRFHCFARGAVASHARFRIVRVGVPVQVGGVTVHPGNLLHGDENGLLSVPEAACAGVLEAVDRMRARERRLMEFVRGPEFTVGRLKGRFLE